MLELSDIAALGVCGFVILTEGATGTSHGKKHILKTCVRKVKTSEGN